MAQDEMRAMRGMPLRVRSMEGLGFAEELCDFGIDGPRMSDRRHVAKTWKLYDSDAGKNRK